MFGQSSNLVIFNGNNQKFKISVDKEAYNESFVEKVVVKDLKSENYSISINFENDSLGAINQQLYVADNITYFFTFVKNKGASFNKEKDNFYQLKLLSQMETSKYTVANEDETLEIVNFKPNKFELDLLNKLNAHSPKEASNFEEITTCVAPLNFKDFEDIKMIIESEKDDDAKTQLVKNFLDKKCFSTQQLYFLLLNVNNESDKINIIKHCEYKIYNPEDFALLTELIKDPFIKNELKSMAYR